MACTTLSHGIKHISACNPLEDKQTSWYFLRQGCIFNRFWIRDHKTSLATSIEIVITCIQRGRTVITNFAGDRALIRLTGTDSLTLGHRMCVTFMPTTFNSSMCSLITGSRRCPATVIAVGQHFSSVQFALDNL